MSSQAIQQQPAEGNAIRAIDSTDRGKYRQYFFVGLVTVIAPFIGTIYAGYLFYQEGISMLNLLMLSVIYFLTVLGLELGYHRLMTHGALKTTRPLYDLLAILGSMCGHGPPTWWVAVHRRHHQHSDHDGDPHSPNLHGESFTQRLRGGWHSHIGWMFQPENTTAHAAHYARDLLNDRRLQAIDRMYWMWMILGLVIPAAIGGLATQSWWGAWTGFIWGGIVRLFFGQHALWWGIVTFCHCWGTRPFRSDDDSTNSLLVAILMLGDGWHNNHHAFPTSAKVGLLPWQIDLTWWVIKLMKFCGVAWEIRVPSPKSIEAKRLPRTAQNKRNRRESATVPSSSLTTASNDT